MEICRLICYVFLNCVVIQYLNAKTVSLNELIAAEEREKKTALGENPQQRIFTERVAKPSSTEEITSTEKHPRRSHLKLLTSKLRDRTAKPFSIEITSTETHSRKSLFALPTIRGLFDRVPLLKRLASNAKRKRLRQDKESLTHTLFSDKKISPLKFRKEFQIRSPLKPKKLKLASTSRQKRKNQSLKREISGNDHLKHKDIPLVKSLNMFDDIIEPGAGDIDRNKIKKHKRYRFDSSELFKDHSRKLSSKSRKKTVTPSSSFSSEASTDTANITSSQDYDNSIDRPNTGIPILLSRNTLGGRRDNNGSSTRSRPAYNRNTKGNISRNHGTHEYNPGIRKNETYAESNEDNTHSNTRNDTSSVEYTRRGRDRYESRNPKDRKAVIFNSSKEENTTDLFRKDKYKTRGIKVEGEEYIPELVRGFRGYIPKSKSTHDENLAESIQFEKIHEESILCSTGNSTCDKRITNESGSFTIENEKIRSRNETMILIESNYPKTEKYFEGGSKKAPVVLIFDGYSVTRDKNGENELSGKTEIHIRS